MGSSLAAHHFLPFLTKFIALIHATSAMLSINSRSLSLATFGVEGSFALQVLDRMRISRILIYIDDPRLRVGPRSAALCGRIARPRLQPEESIFPFDVDASPVQPAASVRWFQMWPERLSNSGP